MRRRPSSSQGETSPPVRSPSPAKGSRASGGEKRSPSNAGVGFLFSSEKRVFALCLAFRALNSLLVRTYFDPDEHWQSLEVAHRIVFGYGHLTWEWKAGIRSYLHPLLFALLYKALALLQLDTPWFMVNAPRLLQSGISSVGDLYLYKLAYCIFNENVARWTIFSTLVNWFMFFCIPRTYSNCLESVLTTVALYYWLCPRTSSSQSSRSSKRLALSIAAVACAVRPTSAITWLYVGVLEIFQTNHKLQFLFLDAAPIGCAILLLLSLLDRWMYGSWVLVPLNFLRFNFFSSGGDQYGTHPWHWYFTQGFPVIVFSFLPLSIHGIYKSKQWKLAGLIIWVLAIYSTLAHKEFRFVLPMLPMALMFAGYSLATLTENHIDGRSSSTGINCHLLRFSIILFLLLSNLPVALYTSLFHQRGREEVMMFLAKEAHSKKVKDILFLMPCHSTPYYSTLHHNLPMRILDCSPSNERGILDESDRFNNDPIGFVSEMAATWSVPSHIVLFDSQEAHLRDFLISHSFVEVKRFFNAHFPVGDVLQASVIVYERQG